MIVAWRWGARADDPRWDGSGLAAKLHGFLVEVVHEFVNQGERNEFDLIGGLRELADEDIAAVINAAFGFGGEHGYVTERGQSTQAVRQSQRKSRPSLSHRGIVFNAFRRADVP